MDKCKWCNKKFDEDAMVSLSLNENEPSMLICNKCYNEYMADLLNVANCEGFEEEATFKDCDDLDHTFQIIKRISPMGVLWEATEFLDGDKIGYLFSIHQDFEDNPNETLKMLYKKIENGLSRKFIEKEILYGREHCGLKNEKVEGRIEWDGRHEENIPKFIIDGEEYSLNEIGRMIMSYEGWNFKLEITEQTE